MKSVKIVPNVCKGEAAKWSGYVVMRVPTFDEKFEYIENIGVSMKEDGTMDSDGSSNRISQVRKMVSLSQKHYMEVSLENKETGEKVASFEEMQYVEDLHGSLVEISGMMASGFRLGNG